MMEVPSVGVSGPLQFAAEGCDFFSVGTNDPRHTSWRWTGHPNWLRRSIPATGG